MKMPNLKNFLTQSAVGKKIYAASSNMFVKIILGLLGVMVASLPIDLYLFVRYLLVPVGFWQEFALFAAAVVVLGWLQVILIIMLIVWIVFLVTEEI
jgi:hypothetical protein